MANASARSVPVKREPHVSNAAAKAAGGPTEFAWRGKVYDIGWKSIVIYDDPDTAEEIATHLDTYAKHASNKFPTASGWKTMSIVPVKADAPDA